MITAPQPPAGSIHGFQFVSMTKIMGQINIKNSILKTATNPPSSKIVLICVSKTELDGIMAHGSTHENGLKIPTESDNLVQDQTFEVMIIPT